MDIWEKLEDSMGSNEKNRWQIFNRSMGSNEKESWKNLKTNLFALITNNKEVLKKLEESNLGNIKKVIYSAIRLCAYMVRNVMTDRKKQDKKIKKNSLVFQVNEILSSFDVPENFDPSACIANANLLPDVKVKFANCSEILSSLAGLKSNRLSGWDSSIKKIMDRFAEISEICYEKEKEQAAKQEQAKQEQAKQEQAKQEQTKQEQKKQEQKKREKEEKINQEYPTELKNFISKYFPELKVTQIDEDRKELISKFAKWFVKIFKQSYLYSRYKYTKFSDLPSKGGRNGYLESLYKGVIVTALIQLSKLTTGDDKKYDLIEYFDKIKNKTPESQTTPHLDLVTKNLNQNKLLNHFMDEESYLKRRLIKEDYKEEKIKAVTHPSYLEILNRSESELKQEITNSIDEELENSKGDKEQKEDKKNKESKNDEKIVKRKKYKKAKRTKPKPKDHKKTKKVKAKEAPNKNEKLNKERKEKAAEQSEEDKLKFRNEKHAKEEEELKKFNEKNEKLQEEYEKFYLKLYEAKNGDYRSMRSALEKWRKEHNAQGLVKDPSGGKLKELLEKMKKQNENESKEENNKSNEEIIKGNKKLKGKNKKSKDTEVPDQNQKLKREREERATNQSEEDKLKFRNEKHAKEEEELKKFNEKNEKLQKEYEEFYLKLYEEKKGNSKSMRNNLESWRKEHNAQGLVKDPSGGKLKDLKEKIEKQNEKENKEENSKNNEDNNQKHPKEKIINEEPVNKKRKRKPSKKTFSDEDEGNEKDDNYIEKMVNNDYEILFETYRLFLEGNKNNKKQGQDSFEWPNKLSNKCRDKFEKLPKELRKELEEKVSESELRTLLQKHDKKRYEEKIQNNLNQIKHNNW